MTNFWGSWFRCGQGAQGQVVTADMVVPVTICQVPPSSAVGSFPVQPRQAVKRVMTSSVASSSVGRRIAASIRWRSAWGWSLGSLR
jgi:hypothetical protein